MAISKEKWADIEKELASLFVNMKFEYKGFELAVQRQRHSESKTALVVYINGEIKGGWSLTEDDCEDRPEILKDVWKLTTKAKYKAEFIKKINKIFGKRRAKKDYPDLHERHEYYLPYFAKASVLVRQFKKLEGITLIEKNSVNI